MLRPTPASSGTRPPICFGDRMDHLLGFRRGQAVELAGVAVGDQDVDAGVDGAVDDGLEALGRDAVLLVKGRDQDAGDARQRLANLRVY